MKTIHFVLLLLLLASTSCKGQSSKNNHQQNSIMDTTQQATMPYIILPPEYYGWTALNDLHSYFRIIAPDEKLFDYRTPDYKGGFYLYFQIAEASEKEFNKKTPFDKLKRPPKTYLAHFISLDNGNHDDGSNSSSDVVSFTFPSFNIEYKLLPADFKLGNFDPASTGGEWQPYSEWIRYMPQDLLLISNQNIYFNERDKEQDELEFKAYVDGINAEVQAATKPTTERCDMALIAQLKAEGRFDTIIRNGNHALYINTDMESFEQSAAPDVFHIVYRKYYPGGALKERRQFLPGVHVSQSFPVGLSVYYDESGATEDIRQTDQLIFHFPQSANVDFCIHLLEREGWIDRKTGKGKATMHINGHVDPHKPGNTERLCIRSPWQIQADDDLYSTVGLLATDGERETVYIVDKNSRKILDKFKR